MQKKKTEVKKQTNKTDQVQNQHARSKSNRVVQRGSRWWDETRTANASGHKRLFEADRAGDSDPCRRWERFSAYQVGFVSLIQEPRDLRGS